MAYVALQSTECHLVDRTAGVGRHLDAQIVGSMTLLIEHLEDPCPPSACDRLRDDPVAAASKNNLICHLT